MEEAERFLRRAYTSQMNGRLDEAIDLYRKSIDLHPTAEAYTFLGWTFSFRGEYEEAIEQCKNAIQVDPEFGNPYNDIGAYLIHLNRFEEAVTWLELACTAPRYDARHFPHFNLGRIYERLGEFGHAIDEYDKAAAIDPEYEAALRASERLQAWMN